MCVVRYLRRMLTTLLAVAVRPYSAASSVLLLLRRRRRRRRLQEERATRRAGADWPGPAGGSPGLAVDALGGGPAGALVAGLLSFFFH